MKFKSENSAFSTPLNNVLGLIPAPKNSADLYGLAIYHLILGSDSQAKHLIESLELDELQSLLGVPKGSRFSKLDSEQKSLLKTTRKLLVEHPEELNPTMWKELHWGGSTIPKNQELYKKSDGHYVICIEDDQNRASFFKTLIEYYQIENFKIVLKDPVLDVCTLISNTKKDPSFFRKSAEEDLEEVYENLISD